MKNITKEKFEAYVAVQKSGVTNMWAVDLVSSLSGLTEDECLDIMKNYAKYESEFKEETLDETCRECGIVIENDITNPKMLCDDCYKICDICNKPEDEDGRCGCTNKDAN